MFRQHSGVRHVRPQPNFFAAVHIASTSELLTSNEVRSFLSVIFLHPLLAKLQWATIPRWEQLTAKGWLVEKLTGGEKLEPVTYRLRRHSADRLTNASHERNLNVWCQDPCISVAWHTLEVDEYPEASFSSSSRFLLHEVNFDTNESRPFVCPSRISLDQSSLQGLSRSYLNYILGRTKNYWRLHMVAGFVHMTENKH